MKLTFLLYSHVSPVKHKRQGHIVNNSEIHFIGYSSSVLLYHFVNEIIKILFCTSLPYESYMKPLRNPLLKIKTYAHIPLFHLRNVNVKYVFNSVFFGQIEPHQFFLFSISQVCQKSQTKISIYIYFTFSISFLQRCRRDIVTCYSRTFFVFHLFC